MKAFTKKDGFAQRIKELKGFELAKRRGEGFHFKRNLENQCKGLLLNEGMVFC